MEEIKAGDIMIGNWFKEQSNQQYMMQSNHF